MNDNLKKYIEMTGSSKDIEEIEKEDKPASKFKSRLVPPNTEAKVNDAEVSIFDEDSEDVEEDIIEDDYYEPIISDTGNNSDAHDISVRPVIFATLIIAIVAAFVTLTMLSKHEDTEDISVDTDISTVSTEEDVVTTIIAGESVEVDPYAEYYMYTNRTNWALFDDVVGELLIPNADLDYLVLQGTDNEKYLSINEYGEEDNHGCIFGDYRNNFENLDENNVIYGHNMADGSMFAKLLRLRDDAYFSEKSDFFIYFNSNGYNNIFKIFSVYETDLTSFNYIQTGFDTATKSLYMQEVRERNEVSTLHPEEVSDEAKLLTLSTCTQQGTHRLVIQAYLVAREVI